MLIIITRAAAISEPLSWARPGVEHFTRVFSLAPHNNHIKEVPLASLHRSTHGGRES